MREGCATWNSGETRVRALRANLSGLTRFNGSSMPLKVNVVTNYTCNLDCAYCNVKDLDKSTMPTLETLHMIDQLSKLGMRQIHFIGGEPLLRKDLEELLTCCKQQGIVTAVHSNGLLLQKMAVQVLDSIDIFYTCLNGPRGVHESSRGKGTFDPTVAAIKLMKSHKAMVVADMIISQNNCEQKTIDYVLTLAKELNFAVNFQPVFEHGLVNIHGNKLGNLVMLDHQLQSTFRYILHYPDHTHIFNSKKYLTDMATRGATQFKRCYMGILSCVIDPQGYVSRCYKYIHHHRNINGRLMGWREAIEQIQLTDCRTCLYTTHIEDNYTFIPRVENTGTGENEYP